MTPEHFKHILDLYAKSNEYELSPFADKIINRIMNIQVSIPGRGYTIK